MSSWYCVTVPWTELIVREYGITFFLGKCRCSPYCLQQRKGLLAASSLPSPLW
jgi:hypothetical protein